MVYVLKKEKINPQNLDIAFSGLYLRHRKKQRKKRQIRTFEDICGQIRTNTDIALFRCNIFATHKPKNKPFMNETLMTTGANPMLEDLQFFLNERTDIIL